MERIQVNYDVIGASLSGVTKHPLQDMEDLGFTVLAGVAQTIGDCWWFTVEKLVEHLPSYVKPMNYDYEYWHGNGTKIVT